MPNTLEAPGKTENCVFIQDEAMTNVKRKNTELQGEVLNMG